MELLSSRAEDLSRAFSFSVCQCICQAERELLKQKNIVKLQAVVRGHLVRRHAVGSLRCVQAIIKMQALVRAHRARLSAKGSTVEAKLDENLGKENNTTKLQVRLPN